MTSTDKGQAAAIDGHLDDAKLEQLRALVLLGGAWVDGFFDTEHDTFPDGEDLLLALIDEVRTARARGVKR